MSSKSIWIEIIPTHSNLLNSDNVENTQKPEYHRMRNDSTTSSLGEQEARELAEYIRQASLSSINSSNQSADAAIIPPSPTWPNNP